jgi:hypothetical protein
LPELGRYVQSQAQVRAQASILGGVQPVRPGPGRIARKPARWIERLTARRRREAEPQALEPGMAPAPSIGTPVWVQQGQPIPANGPGTMVLPAPRRPAPPQTTSRPAPPPVQGTAAAPRQRVEATDDDDLPLAKPPAARSQPEGKAMGAEAAVSQAPAAPAETVTAAPPAVQRAVEDDTDDEQELDLGMLAERVYPFVKRMLQIERERRPYA